jgi:hypothetical protein
MTAEPQTAIFDALPALKSGLVRPARGRVLFSSHARQSNSTDLEHVKLETYEILIAAQ